DGLFPLSAGRCAEPRSALPGRQRRPHLLRRAHAGAACDRLPFHADDLPAFRTARSRAWAGAQLRRAERLRREPHARRSGADDRANQLVIYSSSQTPHLLRIGIARFLGMPEEKVRVIAPDVGGGFGYKCIVFPEDLCVAWLALKYRKPFRYIEDRREHLVAGA